MRDLWFAWELFQTKVCGADGKVEPAGHSALTPMLFCTSVIIHQPPTYSPQAPFPFDLVMREMRRFPNAGACARHCLPAGCGGLPRGVNSTVLPAGTHPM